ncbi:hypothetical protein EROM_051080 [Encephalitozoon romaleae SJ-2008]|uniref:Telomeric single stranded DNA binding POT1/Cdc13 domain-containing protein n=1 Tax=Encephalitozoon romaleae (strain SJ-2008) TaxID=1178016 RepID=I7AMS2_ENCRO|nr:hypothetical protein EROM_051080 [Encephalitozoon romaleae SJ-2008]AFN83039.1 hypothetical protein EROM_051080 [Encephalitozoon romaleae SJ-2008]
MQKEDNGEESTMISDMERNRYHTIYGVIVDWLEWKRCKGRDFMMTLDVIDESMKKLSVKVFSPKKIFSEGFCVGEVVRIGNIKLYDGFRAVTDRNNDVEVVFTPYKHLNGTVSPRAQQLMEFFQKNRKNLVKEREISEIEEGKYFDFNGELIDKQRERTNLVLLRLVDFSRNKLVQGYGGSSKYPKEMVLIVKAWGRFANEAEKCEIGGWYRIRNLKADEVGHNLYASLSESSKGSIIEMEKETTLGRYLGSKKDGYTRGFVCKEMNIETPKRMEKYSLGSIKSIDRPGVYRVRGWIKRYGPPGGMEVFLCRVCGSEDARIDGRCRCNGLETKGIKVLRLLLWDGEEEMVVICRNRLAEYVLDEESREQLGNRMFDCIILSVISKLGMIHHLIDSDFFEVKMED